MAPSHNRSTVLSNASKSYLSLLQAHTIDSTTAPSTSANLGGVVRSISPSTKIDKVKAPVLLGTERVAYQVLGAPVEKYQAPSWAFTGPSAEFIYAAGDVATLPRMVWGLVDGVKHTSMQPGVKALGFTTCLVAISGVSTMSKGHEYLKTAEKVDDVAGKTIGKVLIARGAFESAGGASFIPIRTMNWLGSAKTSPSAASALGMISKIGYGIMGVMYALLMVPSCITVHYARKFKEKLDAKLKEGVIPALEFLKSCLHLDKNEVQTSIDQVLALKKERAVLLPVPLKEKVHGAINKQEMKLIDDAIEKRYPTRLQRKHGWRLSDKKKLVDHISQALIKQKAVKDRDLRRSLGDDVVSTLQKEFAKDEQEMDFDVSGFIEKYANPTDPVCVFAKEKDKKDSVEEATIEAPQESVGESVMSSRGTIDSRKKSLLKALRQDEITSADCREKEKALFHAAKLMGQVKKGFSSNMKVHGAVIAACTVGAIGIGLAILLLFGVGGNAMNIAVYADFSVTTLMMTGIDFTFLFKAYQSGAPIKKEKAVIVLVSLLLVAITVATLISGPTPLLKGLMWGITGTWGVMTAAALFKWVLKKRKEEEQLKRIQAVIKNATSGLPAVPVGGI